MSERPPRRRLCWLLPAVVAAAFCWQSGTAPAQAAPTPPPAPVVSPAPLAGPSASSPEPKALPPIFQPSPIPLGQDLLVGGALDLRTRQATTGRTGGVWINAAELDFQHPITAHGSPRGNIVLQVIGEDPADVRHGQDVEIGEAYVLYKIPIRTDTGTTAFAKFGQFQIPFALLSGYDPHLRLVQPLYAESLGLRTDFGIALTGQLYGYLQYDASLTTGTGPEHIDANPNRVVTLRLGRTFNTRNGVVTVGGSLLSGRLPVTDLSAADPFAVDLAPSGRVRPDRLDIGGERFTPKTRIAVDGTYRFKSTTARGEAMVGADKSNRVQGYYAEGDYGFTRRATALAAYSIFVYPVGNSTSSRGSGGLTYALGPKLSVSALYEYLRDVPRDAGGHVRHRLTLQMLLRF